MRCHPHLPAPAPLTCGLWLPIWILVAIFNTGGSELRSAVAGQARARGSPRFNRTPLIIGGCHPRAGVRGPKAQAAPAPLPFNGAVSWPVLAECCFWKQRDRQGCQGTGASRAVSPRRRGQSPPHYEDELVGTKAIRRRNPRSLSASRHRGSSEKSRSACSSAPSPPSLAWWARPLLLRLTRPGQCPPWRRITDLQGANIRTPIPSH